MKNIKKFIELILNNQANDQDFNQAFILHGTDLLVHPEIIQPKVLSYLIPHIPFTFQYIDFISKNQDLKELIYKEFCEKNIHLDIDDYDIIMNLLKNKMDYLDLNFNCNDFNLSSTKFNELMELITDTNYHLFKKSATRSSVFFQHFLLFMMRKFPLIFYYNLIHNVLSDFYPEVNNHLKENSYKYFKIITNYNLIEFIINNNDNNEASLVLNDDNIYKNYINLVLKLTNSEILKIYESNKDNFGTDWADNVQRELSKENRTIPELIQSIFPIKYYTNIDEAIIFLDHYINKQESPIEDYILESIVNECNNNPTLNRQLIFHIKDLINQSGVNSHVLLHYDFIPIEKNILFTKIEPILKCTIDEFKSNATLKKNIDDLIESLLYKFCTYDCYSLVCSLITKINNYAVNEYIITNHHLNINKFLYNLKTLDLSKENQLLILNNLSTTSIHLNIKNLTKIDPKDLLLKLDELEDDFILMDTPNDELKIQIISHLINNKNYNKLNLFLSIEEFPLDLQIIDYFSNIDFDYEKLGYQSKIKLKDIAIHQGKWDFLINISNNDEFILNTQLYNNQTNDEKIQLFNRLNIDSFEYIEFSPENYILIANRTKELLNLCNYNEIPKNINPQIAFELFKLGFNYNNNHNNSNFIYRNIEIKDLSIDSFEFFIDSLDDEHKVKLINKSISLIDSSIILNNIPKILDNHLKQNINSLALFSSLKNDTEIKNFINQSNLITTQDLYQYLDIINNDTILGMIINKANYKELASLIKTNTLSCEKIIEFINPDEIDGLVSNLKNTNFIHRLNKVLRDHKLIQYTSEQSIYDFINNDLNINQFCLFIDGTEFDSIETNDFILFKTKFLEKLNETNQINLSGLNLIEKLQLNLSETIEILQKINMYGYESLLTGLISNHPEFHSELIHNIKENPFIIARFSEESLIWLTRKRDFIIKLIDNDLNLDKLNLKLFLRNYIDYLEETMHPKLINYFKSNNRWKEGYSNLSNKLAFELVKDVDFSDIYRKHLTFQSKHIELNISGFNIITLTKQKNGWSIKNGSLRPDLKDFILKSIDLLNQEYPLKIKGIFDTESNRFIPNDSDKYSDFSYNIDGSAQEQIDIIIALGIVDKIETEAIRNQSMEYNLIINFDKLNIIPITEFELATHKNKKEIQDIINNILSINESRKWGFELEIGVWDNNQNDIKKHMEQRGFSVQIFNEYKNSSSTKNWEFKQDSSLNEDYFIIEDDVSGEEILSGEVFEIASPIFIGSKGISSARNFLQEMLKKFNMESNELINAGLHVHHDISDLLQLSNSTKILENYLSFQPLLYKLVEEYREHSTHSAKLNPNSLSPKRGEKGGVKISSFETLEFRMKEGTTSVDEIINWIILTQKIVDAISSKLIDNIEEQSKKLIELSEIGTYMLMESQINFFSNHATKKKILKQIRKIIGFQGYSYAS